MSAKKDREVIDFPTEEKPNFKMINVGRKRPTRRLAIAQGSIFMGKDAFDAIKNATLPKGNVLALAEAAGIMGSKKTPDLLPMCHTLPLDQVTVHCCLDDANNAVTVYTQAVAFAKTGVEMEALAGVNAALLTIWDLTKGVDPALSMGATKLLVKTGGKSGVWLHPEGVPDWLLAQLPETTFLKSKTAAVLVMSDRAASGDYIDESGELLNTLLEQSGATISCYKVIPDDKEKIGRAIKSICREQAPDILLASGGTGPRAGEIQGPSGNRPRPRGRLHGHWPLYPAQDGRKWRRAAQRRRCESRPELLFVLHHGRAARLSAIPPGPPALQGCNPRDGGAIWAGRCR